MTGPTSAESDTPATSGNHTTPPADSQVPHHPQAQPAYPPQGQFSGQSYPPQGQFPGQQFPGQPYPPQGQFSGQPYPGQPYPGQPYPGQPYPPQGQFSGQPYPPQGQYPGQQYTGQPYPGQQYPPQGQYPGQPYPAIATSAPQIIVHNSAAAVAGANAYGLRKRNSPMAHLVLLFLTGGIGNIIYAWYVNDWNRKRGL